MKRLITFVEAIREATDQSMSRDKNVILFGLGADDPKSIFGSTKGLKKKYSAKRVFDVPTSENAMTGVGIGAAINGKKPVMVHQRLDFFLLAMDQVVNAAAKWYFMFGNQKSVPITIRLIMGRGWGQGPTHSQNLQAWFAHIPGLKVIMPSTPYDVKGMITSALRGKEPVICLEHRWLYWQKGHVPKKQYLIKNSAKIIKKGKDITLVCTSWMNVEALQAANYLSKKGIKCEIIDLRDLSPIDKNTIINSVKKTKKCIVIDYDWLPYGVSSEVSHILNNNLFGKLNHKIERLGFKFLPCPTSRNLENKFYPNAKDIIKLVGKIFKRNFNTNKINLYSHEKKFKGPF